MTSSELLKSLEEKIDDNFKSMCKELADTKEEFVATKKEISDQITVSANEIKDDLLAIRGTVIENLRQENRTLQRSVSILYERLINVERQANQTEQNNRKSNLEIEGIPATVTHGHLKTVVTNILNYVADSEITERDIEAVHRLHSKSPSKPTIVRMQRNLIDECKLKVNKSKLKSIPGSIINLPTGVRLYINDNQSPNMRQLAYNARLLKRGGLIADTWFANAAVRIKRHDSKIIKVTHEIDLFDEFPTFCWFLIRHFHLPCR